MDIKNIKIPKIFFFALLFLLLFLLWFLALLTILLAKVKFEIKKLDKDNGFVIILGDIAGGNGNEWGRAIYGDKDGNIYITGYSFNGVNDDMFVIKINGNTGELVQDFGDNGVVLFNNIAGGNQDDYGKSLYVDENRNVYVAGYSFNSANNSDAYVIKLDPKGKEIWRKIFDNIANINDWDQGYYITGDKNGNIYLTGYSSNGKNADIFVIKLDNNGNEIWRKVFDNISGGNGDEYGSSLDIDNKGNVYVTGWSYYGELAYMYVIKLNSDGEVDKSFGENGKVLIHSISENRVSCGGTSLKVDSHGNIYLTGLSSDIKIKNFDAIVIKLDSTGKMVSNFGQGGIVILSNIMGLKSNRSVGESLSLDANENIYITGYIFNNTDADVFIVKLDSNGNKVNDLKNNGTIVLDAIGKIKASEVGYSLYVDKMGNIYITGLCFNGANNDAFVLKLVK